MRHEATRGIPVILIWHSHTYPVHWIKRRGSFSDVLEKFRSDYRLSVNPGSLIASFLKTLFCHTPGIVGSQISRSVTCSLSLMNRKATPESNSVIKGALPVWLSYIKDSILITAAQSAPSANACFESNTLWNQPWDYVRRKWPEIGGHWRNRLLK